MYSLDRCREVRNIVDIFVYHPDLSKVSFIDGLLDFRYNYKTAFNFEEH